MEKNKIDFAALSLETDSDSDDELTCPLCVEVMDVSDKNFFPCPCGYRVCMWCWHNIRENHNGLCPACRTPYNDDPHAYTPVDQQEIVKRNKERRAKEKLDKKADAKSKSLLSSNSSGGMSSVGNGSTKPTQNQVVERRNLHNYRVVQRNLVYVIGLPANPSSEEALKRAEYFGQYGKIGKVVVHKNHSGASSGPISTISAYVTFVHKEDAKAAIQALEGHHMESATLRASFGTTKYCNNFIRGLQCNNPDCVYLHELGSDEDRFTKAEIQAGHSKLTPVPGQNQQLVTGMGGPSGTGRRPAGEPVLPPPVFLQDVNPSDSKSSSSSSNSGGSAKPSTSTWASPNANGGVPSDIKGAATRSDRASAAELVRESSADRAERDERAERDVNDGNSGREASKGYSSSRKAKDWDRDNKSGSESTSIAHNLSLSSDKDAAVTTLEQKFSESLKLQNNSKGASSRSATQGMSQQQVSASFNGLGRCAVFTVPISSLGKNTLWSAILDSNEAQNLDINPYGHLSVPVSELFDLTLPPVDAVGLSLWPKPASYYM